MSIQENKQLLQQVVVAILYYLSVMSVSKYNSILQATEKEEQNKGSSERDDDLVVSESSMTSLGSYNFDLGGTSNSKPDPESSLEVSEKESSQHRQALSFLHGPEQSLAPSSFTLQAHALDISEQVEASMELTGPFICQLLIEHKSLLSKVLVGADGKSLLTDGEELSFLCINFNGRMLAL